MATTENRPLKWYQAGAVHGILLVGAVFFVLPLIWMVATSLKPLSQTLQVPTSLRQALLGTGYQARINGKTYNVTLERRIEPSPKKPFWIVRPLQPFAAGEMSHTFGPKVWQGAGKYPMFTPEQLRKMDLVVGPKMTVLADHNNPFVLTGPGKRGVLKLLSGRTVRAELIRKIAPPPKGQSLWLVRQWLPADTDVKEVASTAGDLSRPWAILPKSKLKTTTRIIPENYPVALRRVHFVRSLWNTLYLCAMTVGGVVVSSLIVAYGFAFIEFRGRETLFKITLATMMIPFPIVMVPLYLLHRDLGWIGTFKPLWVWSWFGSAFFIFLLRQFLLGLPRDLMDAARIDGCSELEILWHVVVPLSRPVIAMVALFQFLGTWKDFLGPLIYLSNGSQFTLSLSLQAFSSAHGGTPWHLLMAASTVFSLPLIVVFFLAIKTFIRSVAMTGMKG